VATADARALITALGNVALFASTDKTLPVLNAVHLRRAPATALPAGGPALVVEATDRFCAAQESVPAEWVLPGRNAGLVLDAAEAVAAAKTLDATLRAQANRYLADKPQIRITHEPGSGYASLTLTGHIGPDLSLPVALAEGEFPRGPFNTIMPAQTRRLGKLDGRPWNRRHVFNPRFLAKLAKVKPSHPKANVEFQFTTTGKPALAQIGAAFRVLIMPINEER
jgi:hypothetical protein